MITKPVKARKDHACAYCYKKILAGEDCVSETFREKRWDGALGYRSTYYHVQCWNEIAEKEKRDK